MRRYNKLVRDRIPESIAKEGKKAGVRTADAEEYRKRLADKLVEEAEEYRKEGEMEELADVPEVIRALCGIHHIKAGQPDAIRKRKAGMKGAFRRRVVLERVELPKRKNKV